LFRRYYAGGKNKIFNNKSEKDISRGAGSGPAIIFSGQILLSPWAVNMRPCEGIIHDDDYHFSEKSLGEKRQEKINSPRLIVTKWERLVNTLLL